MTSGNSFNYQHHQQAMLRLLAAGGDGGDLSVTVVNPASTPPNPLSTVFVGIVAQIDVTITNDTGGNITFYSGASPSTWQIFMPMFYASADVLHMDISVANWKFAADPSGMFLSLTYAGADGTIWNPGDDLAFTITNALSNASPSGDSLQINPSNMDGNLPSQVQSPLNLLNPPQPGNAKLNDTLEVTLDTQGSVYVSKSVNDPLTNSIFLNLKNTGSFPVYNGTQPWTGTPQVIVTFIYGLKAGALAPDDDRDQPPLGSAWNIRAKVIVNPNSGWQAVNPQIPYTDLSPQWILQPTNTNSGIIGTGENANVTFEFDTVISFTPPGHTSMRVEFTGFRKDDATAYNDQVFVMDVVKQDPPPTRGLINFFGPDPLIQITQPNQGLSIPLRWAMFDVNAVSLYSSVPGAELVQRKYDNPQPVAYDHEPITAAAPSTSGPVFFTLQAFNGNGAFLNSMQFTVFLECEFFFDERDGQMYPVVLFGNLWWMTQNLNYAAPGSYYYNNDPSYASQYGRVYPFNGSGNVPSPWRVPTQADWKSLLSLFESPNAAYLALVAGGSSNFQAQLGGFGQSAKVWSGIESYGYYWTASADPNGGVTSIFSGMSKQVSADTTLPADWLASVRYVRNA